MVAIETKYLGPTERHGSRYVATACTGNRVCLRADTALRDEENHARVAKALRTKLNWGKDKPMVGGGTKAGMAWVFVDVSDRI